MRNGYISVTNHGFWVIKTPILGFLCIIWDTFQSIYLITHKHTSSMAVTELEMAIPQQPNLPFKSLKVVFLSF